MTSIVKNYLAKLGQSISNLLPEKISQIKDEVTKLFKKVEETQDPTPLLCYAILSEKRVKVLHTHLKNLD